MILALVFALTTAISHQAVAGLTPEEFGYQVVKRDSWTEFRHPEMKSRLRVRYGVNGKLAEYEVLDASGKLVRRDQLEMGQWTREDYGATKTLSVYRGIKGDKLEISTRQGVRVIEHAMEIESCFREEVPNRSLAELETAIRQLSYSGVTERIGGTLETDGCSAYPGGTRGLAKDVEAGLKRGLSCMAGLSEERRLDVAKLLSLIRAPGAGPVRIYCRKAGAEIVHNGATIPAISDDAAARAYTCSDHVWPPAMVVKLDGAALRGQDDREMTLFHEMVHFTGHLHDGGKDVTYLAGLCCENQAPLARQCQSQRSLLAGVCRSTRDSDLREICADLAATELCSYKRRHDRACALLGEPDAMWGARQQGEFQQMMNETMRDSVGSRTTMQAMFERNQRCVRGIGEEGTSGLVGLAGGLGEDSCDSTYYWRGVRSSLRRRLSPRYAEEDREALYSALALGAAIRVANPGSPMVGMEIDRETARAKATFFTGAHAVAADVATDLGEVLGLALRQDIPALQARLARFQERHRNVHHCGERTGGEWIALHALAEETADELEKVDSPSEQHLYNGIQFLRFVCSRKPSP